VVTHATPRVELGATMVGGTVNRVVASRHPDFQVGALVLGNAGWQDYALSDGGALPPAWLSAAAGRHEAPGRASFCPHESS